MTKIDGFCLTCLSKRNTNLPVDFWVESKGINYGRKHNPYKILIANGYDRYAFRYLNKALWVSIDKDKPKVIRYKRIRIKKEDLQKYLIMLKNTTKILMIILNMMMMIFLYILDYLEQKKKKKILNIVYCFG